MKINNVEITILPGKLSECEADAYVLPYYAHHVNPDHERQEVEQAGAKGVRKFIETRLLHQVNRHMLALGDTFITDAQGGKSDKLVNINCRSKDEHLVSHGIRQGLRSMFCQAEKFGLQKVAMVPLCSSDGFAPDTFMEILGKCVRSYSLPHYIKEIIIVCEDEEQANKLKALCQE